MSSSTWSTAFHFHFRPVRQTPDPPDPFSGPETWLKERVEKAVAIEFDRLIPVKQRSSHTIELGQLERLSNLSGFL